jgi:Domain of unknown function (DUF4224)
MTDPICLTRDELTELCRTSRKANQVAFLVRNGIRHYIDAYGWPVVTRAAIGVAPAHEGKPARIPWTPNRAID